MEEKKRVLNIIHKYNLERVFSKEKHGFVDIKKEPYNTLNLNEQKKFKNKEINLEKIQEKNKKKNIIKNYITNNKYNIIIIIIIKLILIINLFDKTKNNRFLDFYFFQHSKIVLKVKGIGENNILNNNLRIIN